MISLAHYLTSDFPSCKSIQDSLFNFYAVLNQFGSQVTGMVQTKQFQVVKLATLFLCTLDDQTIKDYLV